MIAAAHPGPASSRFVSLDVFRGLTIFFMIVVNTAGPGAPAFEQLVHAPWIGFTAADAVFPSFLFAVGTAMSFAFRRPTSTGQFFARILRRGALICLLGFLMYWFPFVAHQPDGSWVWKSFGQTRFPGVLQRIGLCYIAAAIVVRWVKDWRGVLLVAAALLLAYWAILLMFSAPGEAYTKFGNAGTLLDLKLIGADHLYKKDKGFDPEGLLGTLPAIVNVLAGYLVGQAVQATNDKLRLVRRLILLGGALIIAGLAWSPFFPIAKKLWSGSYVLLTIGIDMMLLGGLIALIDVRGLRMGQGFWLVLGRNPLAIYLFSELFVTTLNLFPVRGYESAYAWVGIALFQRIAPGAVGSLLCAITYTMVCWTVGWLLDRKGIIIKV
jgi:alpha-N-acetylglucosaminidase